MHEREALCEFCFDVVPLSFVCFIFLYRTGESAANAGQHAICQLSEGGQNGGKT